MLRYEPSRRIPKVIAAWYRGEDTRDVQVWACDNLAADLVNIRDADEALWTLLLAICGEDLRPAVRRAVEVILDETPRPKDDPFPPPLQTWASRPQLSLRASLILNGGVVDEPEKPIPLPPTAPPEEDALWRIARDVLREGTLESRLEKVFWGPCEVRHGLRVFVNERCPGLGTGSASRP